MSERKAIATIAIVLVIAICPVFCGGTAKLDMGLGVPVSASIVSFGGPVTQVKDGLVPGVGISGEVLLNVTDGIMLGLGTGLYQVGVNGSIVSAVPVNVVMATELEYGSYVFPLEYGVGFCVNFKDRSYSYGIAAHIGAGIDYAITENFFVGFNVSVRMFSEFGKYLYQPFWSIHAEVVPSVSTAVRW